MSLGEFLLIDSIAVKVINDRWNIGVRLARGWRLVSLVETGNTGRELEGQKRPWVCQAEGNFEIIKWDCQLSVWIHSSESQKVVCARCVNLEAIGTRRKNQP